jgi:hypothetical protein
MIEEELLPEYELIADPGSGFYDPWYSAETDPWRASDINMYATTSMPGEEIVMVPEVNVTATPLTAGISPISGTAIMIGLVALFLIMGQK